MRVCLEEVQLLQVKKELFAAAAAQTEPAAPAVWGWLEPGSPTLPHIQLQGNAIALGRGSGRQSIDAKCGAMAKSAFAVEYSLPEGSGSPSVPPSPRQASSEGHSAQFWTSLVAPSLHSASVGARCTVLVPNAASCRCGLRLPLSDLATFAGQSGQRT